MCTTPGLESCPAEIAAMQQLLTCVLVTINKSAVVDTACFMSDRLQHLVFTLRLTDQQLA